MKKLEISENRRKQFEWFKTFSNPCYGANVSIDVTKIVEFAKQNNLSFFIIMLYIVTKKLNEVEEMRMRCINDQPVVFDVINPAYTVMTKTGTFENVRHEFIDDFDEFYQVASTHLEMAKNQTSIKKEEYNPIDCWNEYYITCLPWTHFNHVSHPLPDNKESLSIPRICWSKYIKENDTLKLTLNITVNHMFVDGYPLSLAFNKIQDQINSPETIITKHNNKNN